MNIQYCIKKARETPFKRGEYRLYSVILDSKNRLVSEASNSYSQTHPTMFHYGKCAGFPDKIYLHSEMLALIRDKRRKGVKIITARVNANGEACMAAPCEVCSRALKEFKNIKFVEFTV